MGYVTVHLEYYGRIPPQGGPKVDGLEDDEEDIWDMGLPPPLLEAMVEKISLAMVEAGIQEVDTYVTSLHNTAGQYIDTSTIMDLCLAVEQSPGIRVLKRRWEQE